MRFDSYCEIAQRERNKTNTNNAKISRRKSLTLGFVFGVPITSLLQKILNGKLLKSAKKLGIKKNLKNMKRETYFKQKIRFKGILSDF